MSMYNLIHGVNPLTPLLLGVIGFSPEEIPRFRDVYLKTDGELRICVYTRMGGGNRACWENKGSLDRSDCDCPAHRARRLCDHPLYATDADDSFDCTYRTFEFRVQEAYEPALRRLADGSDNTPPEEKWKDLFTRLKSGDKSDPMVKQVMKKLEPLMQQIQEAFEKKS